jgi:uncharacterized protein YabE (DUF348 family)/3D (Asp-Asp-Asp) domain-containing protein
MFESPSVWKRAISALFILTAAGTLIAANLLTAETDDTLAPTSDGESLSGSGADLAGKLSQTEGATPVDVGEGDTPAAIRPARMVELRTESSSRTFWTLTATLGSFLSETGIVVNKDDKILADGVAIPRDALDDTDLPSVVEVGRFWRVTIDDGPNRQVLRTAAATVRAALQEAGISLNATDGAVPDLDETLAGDTMITVKRSFPLSIHVDGMYIQTRTYHSEMAEVLAQAGITLLENDYTIPDASALLKPNDLVQVIRVTKEYVTEDESIPYQTLWQGTDDLPIDTQAIISQGVPGVRRRRIQIRFENGIEVERAIDSEWVASDPVNEVVGYGTRIELGVVDTPEGPREYWRVVRMRATSYTAASSGKAPDEPGYGRTASGGPAGYGVVAIDRSVVPFRSYVFVPGYGIGYAGDTGSGIRGRWIDLGYEEENFVSWSGYVDVYYLTPVPPVEDINFLLPGRLP